MYENYFIPSIRIHLKEFFETPIEEHIISEFARLQEEYGNIFFQFYENDLETIAKFVKNYEKIFTFKRKYIMMKLQIKIFVGFIYMKMCRNIKYINLVIRQILYVD